MVMQKIKIKPSPGLLVRDPETREPLKKSGEEKERSCYWIRRINDKSVILMNNVKETKNND